jgi:hypothetical protein
LPDEARRLVEALRQRALDLPFAGVGDLLEFRGEACRVERHDDPAVRRIMSGGPAAVFPENGHPYYVHPVHVIGFLIDPAFGCESAPVGLARYPAEAERRDGGRLPERLDGWAWHSFCKTEYASDPSHGGIENFLRCHLSLVGLLDHAAKLGVLSRVNDEGGFFEHRDAGRLAAEVAELNRGIAAFAGRLKDILGDDFAAEITKYPNFERLEAEGRRDETT